MASRSHGNRLAALYSVADSLREISEAFPHSFFESIPLFHRSLWFPVLGLLFVSVGCDSGPQTGTLTGTVNFNGQPYEDAAVMFIDMQSGQAAGTDIQPGGQFTIADPMPLGTYNVYLAPKSVPDEIEQPQAVMMDKTVPPKYWDESTTDITVTVSEGANTATIELVQ